MVEFKTRKIIASWLIVSKQGHRKLITPPPQLLPTGAGLSHTSTTFDFNNRPDGPHKVDEVDWRVAVRPGKPVLMPRISVGRLLEACGSRPFVGRRADA